MKNKHVVVRIEASEYKKLVRLGKKTERPVSWLIRKAIENYLEAKRAN